MNINITSSICYYYFIIAIHKSSYFFLEIEADDLNEARRRLSVVSDNKLVEGLGDVNLNDDEAAVVNFALI